MKLNLSHAFRHLIKSPGFAIVAIIVMALGIGANTAIFSLVHGVLLQALPFEQPDRLVQLWHTPPQASFPGVPRFSLSAANALDWQKENHVFSSMAIYRYGQWDLTGGSKPESIAGSKVSADFFKTLGVTALYGRTLLPDEDRLGNNHEVALSYRLWQSHYGGDRSIVGKDIELDAEKYTVVGIMGPKMLKPAFALLWTPLAMTDKEAAVRGEMTGDVGMRRPIRRMTLSTLASMPRLQIRRVCTGSPVPSVNSEQTLDAWCSLSPSFFSSRAPMSRTSFWLALCPARKRSPFAPRSAPAGRGSSCRS